MHFFVDCQHVYSSSTHSELSDPGIDRKQKRRSSALHSGKISIVGHSTAFPFDAMTGLLVYLCTGQLSCRHRIQKSQLRLVSAGAVVRERFVRYYCFDVLTDRLCPLTEYNLVDLMGRPTHMWAAKGEWMYSMMCDENETFIYLSIRLARRTRLWI